MTATDGPDGMATRFGIRGAVEDEVGFGAGVASPVCARQHEQCGSGVGGFFVVSVSVSFSVSVCIRRQVHVQGRLGGDEGCGPGI